jgi:hypothetical protein
MSNKTSDEALYEDAQNLVDDQDWDGALEKFAAMGSEFGARTDVIQSWAGAYAGKCGLNFIDYFTALGDADLSTTTIFAYLRDAWVGNDAIDPTSCTLAQTKMEEISANPALRTAGQNLFMAVLGMVKIGVYLQHDRSTDACSFTTSVTTEIATGLGLITSNLVYLTAALGSGTITDALDSVNSVCNNPAFPAGTCGKTDPSDVTTSVLDTFHDLLKTDPTNPTAPLGVGNCVDPTVTPCCPP